MATIVYQVLRRADMWVILRDGQDDGAYVAQEAAFEVAAAHASADLRTGHGVRVEAGAPTDPMGASDLGGRPAPGDGFS